ncbi:hypothetical protein GGD67_001636 [Bradyrhizobium sp. IAR9]|nr:hypothetical protein [Bradyrhizobium sp. IAR9]
MNVSCPGNDTRGGEHAATGDQKLGVDHVTPVGRDQPALCGFVEMGGFDDRPELDVLAQIEAVGDVVEPAFDFRLAGEFLAPAPSLVELLGEQILVDVAF